MLIYKDLISGDEMFTDAYKVKLVDDCVYEVYCKHVVRHEGDIVLTGANPSAEEADEGTDSNVQSGLDIVLDQRLCETTFDKDSYKKYLKTYSKALQEKWTELGYTEEKIKELKVQTVNAAKFLIGKAGDSQYFMGESNNVDGLIALLEYRDGQAEDGGELPVMMFLAAGVEVEKC